MQLADIIRKCRTAAGLSQAQVARALGLKKQYVSNVEKGGSISVERATEICAVCGFDLTVTYDVAPARSAE